MHHFQLFKKRPPSALERVPYYVLTEVYENSFTNEFWNTGEISKIFFCLQ